MALRKLSFIVSAKDSNKRLDQFLSETIPQVLSEPLSKAKIRKLIIAGAVYLNRNRVRIASKILLTNAQIEVYLDLAKLKASDETSKDRSIVLSEKHILFEDEFLIAIDKPAGLPTQPTIDEARNNLFQSVKNFLSERDKKIDPYLGIHQRLDRDTSGVILFTKDQKANLGLAQSFSTHKITKVYQAIVSAPIKPLNTRTWTIKNFLGRVRSNKGKQAKYCAVENSGESAETEFILLESLKTALLIEARPKTGRTHQIRVHLSEQGMPIFADSLYDGKSSKFANRMMLHAYSLSLQHPISKKEITIISPLPSDFKQCLNSLRNLSQP